MASEPTDHELLLLLRRDMESLARRLDEALTQLARGNARFEHIGLTEQETRITLGGLRQDFSRAMLTAEEAKRQAAALGDALSAWQTRLKTIVWLGAPVVAIVTTLVVEAVKRLVFP
jgi:hypothetical protein